MSYSVSLGKLGSLNLSALRNFSGEVSNTVFILLSFSLDQATSISGAQMVRDDSSNGISKETSVTLQRNMPVGEGYGYRVLARSEGAHEAAYSYQNNIATYVIGAAQTADYTATLLNVSGGMAMLDGDLFMSRRIDQSFAVARVPDYPDVRILADNQLAGRTNASGNALIPRLRAYDINTISIDQRDIPMDAEIVSTRLVAIPYFRSGINVTFPIRHSRGATFTLLLDNGKAMPAGALVLEAGKAETYTVGFDGQVYVTGLAADTTLLASWNGQSCEFTVHFGASIDPLPDLGVFICKGVKP
jgi:outer membrane usher protein